MYATNHMNLVIIECIQFEYVKRSSEMSDIVYQSSILSTYYFLCCSSFS